MTTLWAARFPGIPGIVLGHNAHIAWGLTNVMADDADFYIEQIDSTLIANVHLRWTIASDTESAKKKFASKASTLSQYVPIRSTHHGPDRDRH